MLDLTALPARYLAAHGAPRVSEVCNVTTSLVGMWIKRGKFPLDAVQKLLEFDPSPITEIAKLYDNPVTPPKLMILVPCSGGVDPRTMECLVAMKEPAVKLKTRAFWSAPHARNSLAAHFLASPAEWSFWSDGDMVHPHGDAKAFKQMADAPEFPDVYAGIHCINRMLHHKKTLVGVAYRGRKRGVGFQFHGAASMEIKDMMKRGPQQRLLAREWMGFGGVLVHRSVFEDIIKTQGAEIRVENESLKKVLGYEYAFFSSEDKNDCGDDLVFCRRARAAGHQPYVDLSLFSSHVGNVALNYQDA